MPRHCHCRPHIEDGIPRMKAFRGVTVTELLVATGGLTCILALLLPALSETKDAADRAACAANLSRLGQALLFYACDHDDLLPDCGASSTRGGGPPDDGVHVASRINAPGTCNWPNVRAVGNQANLWILVRENYASPALFICPATPDRPSLNAYDNPAVMGFLAMDPDTGRATPAEDRFLKRVTAGRCSYSYQVQFVHPATPAETSDPRNATTQARLHPDSLAIAADRNPFTRTDLVRQPIVSPADQPEANSLNHRGRGQNVLYLDGNVRWQITPRCGPLRADGIPDNIYWPDVGSPDDPQSVPCAIDDSFLAP